MWTRRRVRRLMTDCDEAIVHLAEVKVKIDLHVNPRGYCVSIPHCGSELPPADGINRIPIQVGVQRATDKHISRSSVLLQDQSHDNDAFNAVPPRPLTILRINSLNLLGWGYLFVIRVRSSLGYRLRGKNLTGRLQAPATGARHVLRKLKGRKFARRSGLPSSKNVSRVLCGVIHVFSIVAV